jgi:sarcosine oxidase, subunit alpha
MTQPNRLPEGGRIDRSRPLGFIFNGRRFTGFAGDTLASALLANDIHFVGRSFKYHRKRGIFSAGVEEPNALVQLELGGRTEPNARATQVELYDGLIASSQNCWPTLAFDLGAVNGLMSRLYPAGFYYKTFMWPPSFWMTYERVIRRAAGLGKSPREPDPDTYEKIWRHCDVLVIGAGPAGLAAALAAGRSGARVILVDEQAEFGGSLLSRKSLIDGAAATDWMSDAWSELASLPEVLLLPRTTAYGYYDDNYLCLIERSGDHRPAAINGVVPRQRLWHVRAKEVVLATGAIERPLVFGDNDRPGVMLASAIETYVNRYAVAPGRRAVIVTGNDSAYGAALALTEAGTAVTVADLRTDPKGPLLDEARIRSVEVLRGYAIVATHGNLRVSAVEVAPMTVDGRALAGGSRRIECDLVGISGGWNPTVHLYSQSGGKLRYDETLGGFVPGQPRPSQHLAGAVRGTFALGQCLAEGFAAGAAAAEAAGFRGVAAPLPAVDDDETTPARTLWALPARSPDGGGSKRFVDLQNDVTASDIQLAAREGYRSVEHLKRYTTMGMGTDQGKTSNINALAILSETLGAAIPEVGTTTFRPPYTPVTIGAFASRDLGDLLDPIRRTPTHGWAEKVGAPFEDVGQWKRAWYFPKPGESMHAAVNREVKAARTSIGIVDASTLGKIDIQGPDAVKLLNWVYTNAWNNLAIGRSRYGLMLDEAGMVFDDGVTTRIGENHYHMTTTTGGAARVLSWLEEWLQCEWPHYRVFLTSVTEQWATIGVAGPNARKLIAELTQDIPLDDESFPFMSLREGTVAGIPARVFRISFTGELSYEINVPTSYGLALWQALMTAGEKYDITPYGTEAMHVLRAEKGYIIAGQDTDGTVTPGDLGMDWIVSKKKGDFLGRRSLMRPDTMREDRKQLVGLLTQNPSEVIPEGAQIVAEVNPKPPTKMLGHVTSSYYSPNIGRSIALALIESGRQRIGQELLAALPDRTIRVTVTEPRFFDLEGKRING